MIFQTAVQGVILCLCSKGLTKLLVEPEPLTARSGWTLLDIRNISLGRTDAQGLSQATTRGMQ
jgi:hypothetical protein